MNSPRLDIWEPLPPKVHKRRRRWFLVHKNKWHSLGITARQAQAEYLRLAEQLAIPVVHREFLTALYGKTKSRAKRLGREFNFPPEEFEALWKKADGRCMLTGIKFDVGNAPGHTRRPWIPSVDRIDCKKGYVPGNVRIVCNAINTALSEWGDEVFEKLARAYVDRISAPA
jgi:hypothetical protein